MNMKTKIILISFLLSVVTSIMSVVIYQQFYNHNPAVVVQEKIPAKFASLLQGTNSEMINFIEAADKTINTVVHVKTQYSQTYSSGSVYDFFFGQRYYQQQVPVLSSGSGVIISNDGYIVTNNHVIQKAEYIEVVLNDQRSYPAKIIGSDPTTDIALLKIEDKDLPFIQYGNSDEIMIGEWVLAVGNPFNLTSTVTAGIVSAKARNINILSKDFAIESFIQTDAAVNPGNSGGALVNTRGELIGINTAIASNTGSFTGYSFAIPVNIVKKIVADLVEFGVVQRAYLGVSIANIDNKLAQQKGFDKIEGVFVEGVYPEGAASDAGIIGGDVIVMVEDIAVNSVSALQEQMSKYRPGNKVNLTIKRNNILKLFVVTLRNKQGNTDIVLNDVRTVLGAKFQDLTSEDRVKLKIKNGVKVKELGNGKLKEAGISNGFIITSINRKQVYSVSDIENFVNSSKGGVLIEGVYPNGMVAYYAIGI
jgi:serine protease Do